MAIGSCLLDRAYLIWIHACWIVTIGSAGQPVDVSLIRRASAQGVSDHAPCALDINLPHFSSNNFSKHLQWKPALTAFWSQQVNPHNPRPKRPTATMAPWNARSSYNNIN